MMLQYRHLPRLQTKRIVFEDVIASRDSSTLEHLKELSSKRRAIEESINHTSSITEAIAREISGGSTCRYEQERLRLEQYLPLLENFISHADLIRSNSQMIDSLHFELGMSLFLYGAVLRENALERLPAELKQSAFVFRQAAGVFHYLAHEVFPYSQPQISERPPEATSSVCAAISLICLAEAQAVYIRKAEETGNTGFGVLSKLHHGVAELLGEASSALYLATAEKAISQNFLEFVSCCKVLHELQGQKYQAEVLREDGQIGIAIGVLRNALMNVENNMPGEEAWKVIFRKEMEAAAEILRKFEHENEFIWHEKIQSADDLPLPQGNKIVKMEPYQPRRWERELAFKL